MPDETPEIPAPASRKRAETVSRLLEAAGEVIAEKGFQRASLDEIAARAGLTKGAIYSNFGSKDDLFIALASTRSLGFRGEMQPGLTLKQNFLRLLDAYLAILPSARADAAFAAEFLLYVLSHEELRQRMAARFEANASRPPFEGVEAYLSATGRPPAKTFRVILQAMSLGLALQHALTPELVTEDVVRAAFKLLAGVPED